MIELVSSLKCFCIRQGKGKGVGLVECVLFPLLALDAAYIASGALRLSIDICITYGGRKLFLYLKYLTCVC